MSALDRLRALIKERGEEGSVSFVSAFSPVRENVSAGEEVSGIAYPAISTLFFPSNRNELPPAKVDPEFFHARRDPTDKTDKTSPAICQPPPQLSDACRRCGHPMGWPAPRGVVYADGSAEHHECRIWAAAERAVASPDALADEAETMLRGEEP